jgi:hypothetical protein
VLGKIVIEEELKKSSPSFEKIKEYLGKIKSRGTRQRLRNRALKLIKESNSSSTALNL